MLGLLAETALVGPLNETVLHAAISSCFSTWDCRNALDVVDVVTALACTDDDDDDRGRNHVLLMQFLNATRTDGASALHLVVEKIMSIKNKSSKMMDMLHRLLQMHVDTEGWNAAGLTPLQVAIQHGGGAAILERMLTDKGGGCDKDGRAEDGRVPLMVALQANNVHAFHMLWEHGANANLVMPYTRHTLWDLLCTYQQQQQQYHDPSIVDAMIQRVFVAKTSSQEQKDWTSPLHADAATRLLVPPRDGRRTSAAEFPSRSIDPVDTIVVPEKGKHKEVVTLSKQAWGVLANDRHWQDYLSSRFKREEHSTLRLVAMEAKQQARTWLSKRIGKQKILADALLLRQQHVTEHGRALDAAIAHDLAEKVRRPRI
ncbi:hypothetical protein DYB37_001722 [Aphanomyces astaci]|uniref:Uncharacterized protein n=1 Tax=Aphanomyces astaci TaxID=112090 RepID=A0A3R7AI28_APHAT|nr:hypothetical protein DYB35_005344 [Aphanomyces astaci]RHZ03649.1 hypothetical protein DYB37_001722 [Aphanomyces astaci]